MFIQFFERGLQLPKLPIVRQVVPHTVPHPLSSDHARYKCLRLHAQLGLEALVYAFLLMREQAAEALNDVFEHQHHVSDILIAGCVLLLLLIVVLWSDIVDAGLILAKLASKATIIGQKFVWYLDLYFSGLEIGHPV